MDITKTHILAWLVFVNLQTRAPSALLVMKRLKIGFEPLFDADLQKIIDEVFGFPPEVVTRMNALTRPPSP